LHEGESCWKFDNFEVLILKKYFLIEHFY